MLVAPLAPTPPSFSMHGWIRTLGVERQGFSNHAKHTMVWDSMLIDLAYILGYFTPHAVDDGDGHKDEDENRTILIKHFAKTLRRCRDLRARAMEIRHN